MSSRHISTFDRLRSDLQLSSDMGVERLVHNAPNHLTLQALRFEAVAVPPHLALYADLTLFNGYHYLILLAIHCDIGESERFYLVFPDTTNTLPEAIIEQMQSQVEAQWRRLRAEQGTPFVNGIVDLVDSPNSLLRAQPTTTTGLTERDIPGRAPYRNIVRAVRAYQFAKALSEDKTILDYGCGCGMGSLILAQSAQRVTGVDLDPDAIAIAESFNLKDNVSFATLEEMRKLGNWEIGDDSPIQQFEVVTAFEVMEHTDDPDEFLTTLKRSLSPDGTLILSVPNRQYHGQHINPFHKTDFSLPSLDELLRQHFEDVQLFGQRASTSPNPFDNYTVAEPGDNADEHFVAICRGDKGQGARDKETESDLTPSPFHPLTLSTRQRRVLMVSRPNALTQSDDDTVTMQRLKAHVERLDSDLHMDIILSTQPLADGYDVVHLFNLSDSSWMRGQLQSLQRTRSPETPLLLTPLYRDVSEEVWARAAVQAIFTQEPSQRLPGALRALAEGRVEVGGMTPQGRHAPYPSYEDDQRAILRQADYLLPCSYAEMQRLARNFGIHQTPFTVIPTGVDPERLANADPEQFAKEHGLRNGAESVPYVLCVGRIEPRRNQLLLLYALRDLDIPIVLIGDCYDAEYRELCQRFAPPRTLFLDRVGDEMLASAYAAAQVHALPSWGETPGITSLEAALCDCSIVVGDRGAEWECLQDGAHYCNPADVDSIRQAVLTAYDNHDTPEEQARRERLRARILSEFTGERAAQRLLGVYSTQRRKEAKTRRRQLSVSSDQLAVSSDQSIKASVVVVTYNSAATLTPCLESVVAHTPESSEIILVDNASTDGTTQILQDFAQKHPQRVSLILNETNKGFSAASNQGLQAAQGEYLILLNPDTIVTEGWLERLTAHFERVGNETVGAVGPTSNYVAGLQQVGLHLDANALPHRADGQVEANTVARALAEQNAGRGVETQLLIGFCLALKREVMEKVGLLDETMFLGNEDLDYSLRLRQAGYRLLVATDAFVYHHGQASFSTLDPETKRQRMQQSVDALYAKLERQFGAGNVPSSTELWGMDIMGIPTQRKALPDVKVALLYDNTVRPDTTGEYCQRALERLCHVTHYLPTQLHHLRQHTGDSEPPPTNPEPSTLTPAFDLYLHVDDGLDYSIPAGLHPSAYWVIDTHLQYERDLEKAQQFDFVFAAQKDGAERLQRDGIANALWLPLACDPDIHAPHAVEKTYDVCFVGHTFTSTPLEGERERLLEIIRQEFPNHFIGRRFFHEMARIYSTSRLVFNRSVRNDLNMRVFEALACGSLLITNDLSDNGQDELFIPGAHLVTYQNEQELVEKIRFYLSHPNEREYIAATGRQEALAKHTYRHRMETILTMCQVESVKCQDPVQPATETLHLTPDTLHPSDERSLTSLIILCCNELDYTRLCVESALRYTDAPYELIFVDNGSTDGTPAYLHNVAEGVKSGRFQSSLCQRVAVLRNEENLGFPKGVNQGLTEARGDYLLLLNNDTVVTDGYLSRLIAHAESAPEMGLVGVVSNYAAPPQQIAASYQTLDEMHAFAARVAQQERGRHFEWGRVVGLCLLIKREVIGRIGELDERFGVGFFDDDDLSWRARQAGYKLLVAQDVFIHHFGSRTFQGLGIDTEAQLKENFRKFKDKWGDAIAQNWRPPDGWEEEERRASVGEHKASEAVSQHPMLPTPQTLGNGEAPLSFPSPTSQQASPPDELLMEVARWCAEGKPEKAIDRLLRRIERAEGGTIPPALVAALQAATAALEAKWQVADHPPKGFRPPTKSQRKVWQRRLKRAQQALASLPSPPLEEPLPFVPTADVNPPASIPLASAPTGNPMPVSLCLIVKNEEKNLPT